MKTPRSTWIALTLGLTALGCPPPAPPLDVTAPPPIDTASAAPVGPDRSALPTPADAELWSLPNVASWKLPNGISVWHLEQTSAPLVSMRMTFPRGASSDPKGKAGLTALTADMLDEGAAGKSSLEIGEALQRLATDFGASTSTDDVTLSLDMLADAVGPSLALFADLTQRASLPREEFERRKGLWMAQALSRESNPDTARVSIVRRVLYGNGYGGSLSVGNKTTLKRITHADVARQFKAVFQPDGATIVVVGAIDRAKLEAELVDKFGGWKGKPSAAVTPVAASKLPTKAVYLSDFPGSTQSSVSVARRSDGVDAADYFPARVFNWALGGAFSSRLNLNLREDKGYTYGARSGFDRWKSAGMFMLSSRVKRETTRPSINEMLKEIESISGSQPVEAREHSEAINGLMLGFPGRFERLSSTAGQLVYQAAIGHDANWLGGWPGRLKQVDLEAARASAKAHGGLDDYAIIVAGDASTIGESLGGLDRPVFRCDAEGNCKR
jgi:zinc protease